MISDWTITPGQQIISITHARGYLKPKTHLGALARKLGGFGSGLEVSDGGDTAEIGSRYLDIAMYGDMYGNQKATLNLYWYGPRCFHELVALEIFEASTTLFDRAVYSRAPGLYLPSTLHGIATAGDAVPELIRVGVRSVIREVLK